MDHWEWSWLNSCSLRIACKRSSTSTSFLSILEVNILATMLHHDVKVSFGRTEVTTAVVQCEIIVVNSLHHSIFKCCRLRAERPDSVPRSLLLLESVPWHPQSHASHCHGLLKGALTSYLLRIHSNPVSFANRAAAVWGKRPSHARVREWVAFVGGRETYNSILRIMHDCIEFMRLNLNFGWVFHSVGLERFDPTTWRMLVLVSYFV